MPGPEKSHLSAHGGGYDFVVSTTQASLKSGLKEYLHKVDQPAAEFCFITDSKGEEIAEVITPEELKENSGGVDPFTIPHGTPTSDDGVKALTAIYFAVAIQFKLGLPQSTLPKDLPPVIELSDDPRTVRFHLMKEELDIVVN